MGHLEEDEDPGTGLFFFRQKAPTGAGAGVQAAGRGRLAGRQRNHFTGASTPRTQRPEPGQAVPSKAPGALLDMAAAARRGRPPSRPRPSVDWVRRLGSERRLDHTRRELGGTGKWSQPGGSEGQGSA